MSDNYGPQWCINNEEAGGGIALILGLILVMIILIPAYWLGWYWAVRIWDVKVFKYPFATLVAGIYAVALYMLCFVSIYAALVVMVLAWLLWDYFTAKRILQQMQLIQTIRKSTRWLFSAWRK
ncbi:MULTISPECIES: hypothetical protein [Sulfurospirillum]|uniref:Membrane protein n=4 Tax=Sulfurospirillum TaxID=57665 RepID=A0A1Y0HMK5_9BACT|nr:MULTISPECIES: hypothetical protein [Sulfurospirillum]AHJ12839.1 putative membrane protein [Sulfurospirillum multivorans DSM 12446]AOO65315.1 putative membrane protein [Sulfurospirillum halorespirans DSM 13726]ARU48796.1 hypothetical protein Sdiek1_1633 [Sulfurospirillum diekertiae]ASC93617.1 hypothetical protein Sdiek2_1599 [Sulfurospirillum diekertiae]ATB69660.1 putative membrane protein [Sulfurospirillum diekertiae]